VDNGLGWPEQSIVEDSRIASSMFETARAIIESSLPLDLTRRERRLAFAKRLYAGELPDAALLAFAEWNGCAAP